MKLKLLIRLIQAVLGLFIGVFWIMYPNDFSEPILVILASTIILIEGILFVKKKELKEKDLRLKTAWITLTLVVLVSAVSFYFASIQMENILSVNNTNPNVESLDKIEISSDLDSLKSVLDDIRTTQLIDKNNNNPERKLPPADEINEVLDTIGSKLWSWIKTILFWLVVILVGYGLFAGIIMNSL